MLCASASVQPTAIAGALSGVVFSLVIAAERLA
jgi:hypothetical protein